VLPVQFAQALGGVFRQAYTCYLLVPTSPPTPHKGEIAGVGFFLGKSMDLRLTIDRLKTVIRYEADTGQFFWLDANKKRNSNSVAGSVMGRGYLSITVDGVSYLAHRLAWFYSHEKWPAGQIDHINENKLDNGLCNLRDVSQTCNLLNQSKPQKNNQIGLRGVSYCPKKGLYRAQLMLRGKQYHLGHFVDPLAAHQAYLDAKQGAK